MDLMVSPVDNLSGTVKAPPSKSYTHRAVIIASLASGRSMINEPLVAEDTLASLNACRAFGVSIIEDGGWAVDGCSGRLMTPEDVIDLKNSGTTLRLMTSVAGLAENYTIFTGDSSLRKRPMQPLLDALKPLGVTALSSRMNGMAPIIVRGGLRGGRTSIDGSVSSQFISSILIAAPLTSDGVELKVVGDFISKPYVDMTVDLMERFSAKVSYSDGTFNVKPHRYKGADYRVEGDYSSASYIAGAAAVAGGEVKIRNLFRESKQGDKLILDILSDMGADIEWGAEHVIISSDGELSGVEVDLHNSPDLLPTVAALGAVADGVTVISGVEHARFKETDRIRTCFTELSRLGLDVTEKDDGMIIKGEVTGKRVKSHGDHRLAMAFSLVGIKSGILIEDAEVFSVSFPDFLRIMEQIGCKFRTLGSKTHS